MLQSLPIGQSSALTTMQISIQTPGLISSLRYKCGTKFEFPGFCTIFVLNGHIFLWTIGYSDHSVAWLVNFWNGYSVVIGIMCVLGTMVTILWASLHSFIFVPILFSHFYLDLPCVHFLKAFYTKLLFTISTTIPHIQFIATHMNHPIKIQINHKVSHCITSSIPYIVHGMTGDRISHWHEQY
jgi:hypothetical protein